MQVGTDNPRFSKDQSLSTFEDLVWWLPLWSPATQNTHTDKDNMRSFAMKQGTKSENCIGKITNMHEEAVIFPIKMGRNKRGR